MTTEYNPVCGTDNVDYTNPGGLGCAGRCGKGTIYLIKRRKFIIFNNLVCLAIKKVYND